MSVGLNSSEARALIEARLGRPPEDAYEAAVVLEAWGGERAGSVFRLSSEAMRSGQERTRIAGTRVVDADTGRTAADGVATLLTVLAVAAWSMPLATALGSNERTAFGLALPLALAVQWAVRSRYRIIGERRLVGLRRDAPRAAVATATGTLAASLFLGRAGLVAALLVLIWAGGSVVARAGWGWSQVITVGVVAVALNLQAPVLAVLGTAAAVTLAAVVAVTRREDPHAQPGPGRIACAGAASGLLLGLLLTADSAISWGTAWVLGVALVPSVLAALWTGVYLSRLHVRLVEQLTDVEPRWRGSPTAGLRLLGGAGLRYLGCCAALSIALVPLITSTEPSIRVLLLAFGIVGILSTGVAFLEALGRRVAAVGAMAAALTTAIGLAQSGHHAAGAPIVVGAAVGAAIAVWCAAVVLCRPAQLLATRLWIV